MAEEAVNSGSGAASATPQAAWAQAFHPLATGTRIGELTIQSVLGAGEFGITYLTEHETRGKRYVLKEYFPRAVAYRDGPTVRAMPAAKADFAWGLDRFLAEGRALQKLKHASIVAVHGVTEANGSGYIGMAYEVGQDLNIWLHGLRRLPTQDEVDKLVAPITAALEYAHANGVMHQDLTPESVIMRDSGVPILIDFGACRAGLRRRIGKSADSPHPFAAPELASAEGEHVGPWSDIYGLAGLLYWAVTKRQPPLASKRVLHDELSPVGLATEGRYRADFLAAIDGGLQFRPGERPQAMAVWREQLLRKEAVKMPSARAAAVREQGPEAAQQTPGVRPSLQLEDETAEPPAPENLMENPAFRSLFYGIAGLIGGALAGALSSIVVASIIDPNCFADRCIGNVWPITTLIGAVAGVVVGVRAARSPEPAGNSVEF